MLLIYSFVFGTIMQTRWPGTLPESMAGFALTLFAGLLVFEVFSENINRAPLLVVWNPNYVKKVVFPLEILPVVVMCSSLAHLFISLLVFFAGFFLVAHTLPLTALAFPLVLIPVVLGTLGLSWFLASVGVFLRDIGQLTGTVTTGLMFVSGLFFPVSAVPENLSFLVHWNPLAWSIEQSRACLVFDQWPASIPLVLATVLSFVLAWAGFAWFQKTRPEFSEVV